MNTIDEQQRFIELRAKGYSFDKISKELKKSKPTLIEWNKKLDVEIANQKLIEIESLVNEYQLNIESRYKRIGKILDRIEKAIDKLDWSKLSAKDQLEYYLRYLQLAKIEAEKLELMQKETEPEAEIRSFIWKCYTPEQIAEQERKRQNRSIS